MIYIYTFLILLLQVINCTKRDIIDYKKLESLQNSVKNVDEHEFNNTFSMFIDAAGFDDLIENYRIKIKETIEKRVNDALILK
jgi:hypothetical protein